MSYEILKYVGIGLLAVGTIGAAVALLHWVYHKLKSFAIHWWEDQKLRFKKGERCTLYVNLRDLSNQIMRGADKIYLKMTGKTLHDRGRIIEKKTVTLPPIDDTFELQTDVVCNLKTAKKLLEDQNAEQKPVIVLCA